MNVTDLMRPCKQSIPPDGDTPSLLILDFTGRRDAVPPAIRLQGESEGPVFKINADCAALLELSKEDLVSKRIFQLFLNQSRHRSRPKDRIESFLSKPTLSGIAHLKGNVSLLKLSFKLVDKLIHYLHYYIHR